MVLRLAALPPVLRHFVVSRLTQHVVKREASQFISRSPFTPNFFIRSPAPLRFRRRWLWLFPVIGGSAFYLAPNTSPHTLPTVFNSPTLIPCNPSLPRSDTIILSPDEPERSFVCRIRDILHEILWEPLLTGRRFIYLLFLFVPVLLSSPMLLVGRPEELLVGDRWGAVWWYGFLTAQMQRAGPTFVKLAQWAASRADLFPTLLCDRLGALHSNGRAHSLSHTKWVIERVFQRPFEDVFEEFDETPIGCGAIAQVYRATLKSNLVPPSHLTPKRPPSRRPAVLSPAIIQTPPTAAVAIKVLHPRVEKTIRRDLKIMAFFANALTYLPGVQWLSLPEEVSVFGKMMHEQLDLRIEADNLIEFETKFQGRNLPVSFPRPLKMWSTRSVLIEEFEHALPLEIFMRNGGGPYNTFLAEVGLDAFLNMLLLDNFVHSDLHPGNIMIRFCKPVSAATLLKNIWVTVKARWLGSNVGGTAAYIGHGDADSDSIVNALLEVKGDPVSWRKQLYAVQSQGYLPEIVFIDAGLVTTLGAIDRQNFLDLFRAVAEFDGYRAGELMVSRCRTPELAIDTGTFSLKMQHIVLNVKRKTFSLGQIKISDILSDVLAAVRQHHVKMEADFVNTVISILLLEGIGRQLDPKLDLFKSALPILRQLGRQMSTQENMKELPSGSMGAFLKLWVWMEARELASSALVDADELVRYDWLTPGI